MSATLPNGWTTATLGEVTTHRVDQAGPPIGQPSFNYIDIGSVDTATKSVGDARVVPTAEAPSRARQRVAGDDVLVSMTRPNLNAVARVPSRLDGAVCSTGFHVLRANRAVDPGWLYAAVRSYDFVGAMTKKVQGALYPAIRSDDVRAFQIGLPPINEQRRIVAKLDAIFEQTRAAKVRLDLLPALLDKLKRSILAAAFRGDLTADWRAAHPDVEPASALLDRIHRAHQDRWERDLRAKGKDPRKAKRAELPVVNVTDLPTLPHGWAWAPAELVVEPGTVVTYGIVLPGKHVADGVPYVRQQDIQDGGVKVSELLRTSPAIAAKYERSSLREGDVLLCIIRHRRVAIVPPGLDGANITQGAVRLRPSEWVRGPFLAAWLESPVAQHWMEGRVFGLDMPRINVGDAREVPVPVPPLAEQDRIVELLRDASERLRHLTDACTNAARLVDQMEQASLAKAFRGELVDQDPADEPASALLDRLRDATDAGTKPVAPRTDSPKGRRNKRSVVAVEGEP